MPHFIFLFEYVFRFDFKVYCKVAMKTSFRSQFLSNYFVVLLYFWRAKYGETAPFDTRY